MKIVLKKEVLDRIKSDPRLYGEVALQLGVAPATLPALIYRNDPKLTQAGILEILKSSLGKYSNEELLERQESEDTQPV